MRGYEEEGHTLQHLYLHGELCGRVLGYLLVGEEDEVVDGFERVEDVEGGLFSFWGGISRAVVSWI